MNLGFPVLKGSIKKYVSLGFSEAYGFLEGKHFVNELLRRAIAEITNFLWKQFFVEDNCKNWGL